VRLAVGFLDLFNFLHLRSQALRQGVGLNLQRRQHVRDLRPHFLLPHESARGMAADHLSETVRQLRFLLHGRRQRSNLGVEVVGFIVLSPEFREVRVPHRQRPVGRQLQTLNMREQLCLPVLKHLYGGLEVGQILLHPFQRALECLLLGPQPLVGLHLQGGQAQGRPVGLLLPLPQPRHLLPPRRGPSGSRGRVPDVLQH